MVNRWSDIFVDALHSVGVQCENVNRVNGWLETAIVSNRTCFMKSATYDASKEFYFLGIDPGKLRESGDLVVICGGFKDSLKDIFLIPWQEFFQTISMGEAINTYKLPKVYYQYKFKIYNISNDWKMVVQGGTKPIKSISKWHNEPRSALNYFR
jgi:hypothetical protein